MFEILWALLAGYDLKTFVNCITNQNKIYETILVALSYCKKLYAKIKGIEIFFFLPPNIIT